MIKPTGLILWEGPSRLNKEEIVVVGILESANVKTGNLIQTFIMPKNVDPITAINSGYDECVCGSCLLKGRIIESYRGNYLGIHHKTTKNIGRVCYVRVDWVVNQAWNKYKSGGYPKYNYHQHSKLFKGRKIRLGAYGDPLAVPLKIWQRYLKLCNGHTGYSKQWPNYRNNHYKNYVQASVFNEQEKIFANKVGFHTFRIKNKNDKNSLPGEITCPASINEKITCEKCMQCSGQKRNVVIDVHGSIAKVANFNRVLLK